MSDDVYAIKLAALMLLTICLVGMGIVAVYDYLDGLWKDREEMGDEP